MNYWAAEIVTHADTALSSDHAQVWADFEASSSAVVVGNNDLIYNLPAGYQIAGEGSSTPLARARLSITNPR